MILKVVDTQGVQGAVATCFNLSSELVWTQVPSDHHIFEDNLLERELPENNLIQTPKNQLGGYLPARAEAANLRIFW